MQYSIMVRLRVQGSSEGTPHGKLVNLSCVMMWFENAQALCLKVLLTCGANHLVEGSSQRRILLFRVYTVDGSSHTSPQKI